VCTDFKNTCLSCDPSIVKLLRKKGAKLLFVPPNFLQPAPKKMGSACIKGKKASEVMVILCNTKTGVRNANLENESSDDFAI
jgi:hypothetical protein